MEKKVQKEDQLKIYDYKGTTKKLLKKNYFKVEDTEILTIRFDPEDTMIAAGCANGTLRIYHLHSGNLKFNEKVYQGTSVSPCTSIRWRPPQFSSKTKNVLITGGSDGSIIHWHATNGKELSRIVEKDNQVNCLDFNKDGTQFVTGGKDCIVRIYDEEQQICVNELQGVDWKDPGHNNRLFSVKFIQDDPNMIITGGWDTNIHIWDQRDKKVARSILGPKICGDAIDFKNNKILTGAYRAREQLEVWDFNTCKLIQQIDWDPNLKKENGAMIFGCQFSKQNDECIIAGSSGLNQARAFDTSRDNIPYGWVEGFEKGVYSVDFGNFSNKFGFAGGDGVILVMSLSSQ